METLKNLNKLWRTTTLLPSTITTTYSDASDYRVYNTTKVLSEDEEDEEESFFELEVVMLNSRTKEEEKERLRQSSNEVNNGRRVVPVEPDMRRQHPHPHSPSPVSILKSAPKFKVSLFKKHINNNIGKSSDPKMKQRPKMDDEEKEKLSATTISTLIRENSSFSSTNHVSKHRMKKCKTEYNNDDDDSVSTDSVSIDSSSSSSNRFSKDMMHKYLKLKLIKPIHLKLAKRSASLNNITNRSSSSTSSSSSASISSSNGYGFRVVCKQLRKSRSASSMMVGSTRRDESLMVEHDDDGGIQSAILHCKKSFNSSTDSSAQSSSKCSEQETSS